MPIYITFYYGTETCIISITTFPTDQSCALTTQERGYQRLISLAKPFFKAWSADTQCATEKGDWKISPSINETCLQQYSLSSGVEQGTQFGCLMGW